MSTKHILTLNKWIPLGIKESQELFLKCRDLQKIGLNLVQRICALLQRLKAKQYIKNSDKELELQLEIVEDVTTIMENIVLRFSNLFKELSEEKVSILETKLKMWKNNLWQIKLKICYFIQEFICETVHLFIHHGERLLVLILKISTSYNTLLQMDNKFNLTKSSSVCSNTCPYLMFPLRKISVTRMLQLLAYNRAEMCCHKLIDCLLDTYKLYDTSDEDNTSDNSSLEIYIALTKHMSPPVDIAEKQIDENESEFDSGNFQSLEELISNEEKNVLDLLVITVRSAPVMLGHDAVKKSRASGVTKISEKAKAKVLDYYQEVLWGEVGNYLEHIVLWWAASPLSARPPRSSQHLRDWILQFIPTADLPLAVHSTLTSLADALGVHVTSTSWDEKFRLALVATKTTCNPDTGKYFSELLNDLVNLCNQCEVTPDWIVGAPLDELPLVEQIPVLHRLDHSIHTASLWALNEAKKIANCWNMEGFFMVIHNDIAECVAQLNGLRLSDHSVQIEKGGLAVHVEVCALMRAKLASEVKANMEKLKNAPSEAVNGLASVCRTISLANLQMIFPPVAYWRQNPDCLPDKPSQYVDKYLERVLTPVIKATSDHTVINMILRIICESWLDHIYMNKVKFSQHGALQLLCDFDHVTRWINESSLITPLIRKKMLKNEVLKRCEGVGKLLLRSPGEHLTMADKNKRKYSKPESENSDNKELMPAEMYVPNQEQWLELRAVKKRNLFIPALCCGK